MLTIIRKLNWYLNSALELTYHSQAYVICRYCQFSHLVMTRPVSLFGYFKIKVPFNTVNTKHYTFARNAKSIARQKRKNIPISPHRQYKFKTKKWNKFNVPFLISFNFNKTFQDESAFTNIPFYSQVFYIKIWNHIWKYHVFLLCYSNSMQKSLCFCLCKQIPKADQIFITLQRN